MELAQVLPLTDSGTAKMRQEEIVRRAQPNVNLYNRTSKTDFRGGTASVTTHRLLWIDPERRRPMYWELAKVTSVSSHAGFGWSHPKVNVHFAGEGDPYIRLSFQAGGKSDFFEQLQGALSKKSWIVKVERKVAPTVRGVGIQGLLNRENQKRESTAKLTTEAFADLKALASNAKKVVAIAERFAAQRRNAAADGQQEDANTFGSILQNAGIVNPVTKQGAGNLYHEELARQIAHFLREPLRRNGDMLLLTDIYCMYNRARGTDLVSPDDVLAACRQLERLRLGMKLRLFNTGVMVVQSDSHDPKAVVKRLLALLQKRGYVDAAYLASTWRVSVPVAEEHLLAAELSGALCRDDSLQGLRFYPNRFSGLPDPPRRRS